MSYKGKNASFKTMHLEGYADFATADGSPKRAGRTVYVVDENNFYSDNGTELTINATVSLATLEDGQGIYWDATAQKFINRYPIDAIINESVGNEYENTYSINVDAAGNITEESVAGSGITVSKTGTGTYSVDYSSLNLTEIPTLNGVVNSSFDDSFSRTAEATSITNSGCIITTKFAQNPGSKSDYDFSLTIEKTGADHKKNAVLNVFTDADGVYEAVKSSRDANTYSLNVDSSGNITEQSDANSGIVVSKGITGEYTVNYSSLSLTNLPSVQVTTAVANSSTATTSAAIVDNEYTAQSVKIEIQFTSNDVGSNVPFSISITRQGSDYVKAEDVKIYQGGQALFEGITSTNYSNEYENTFSINVDSSGNITEQSILNSGISVSKVSAGIFDIDFSSLSLSEIPSISYALERESVNGAVTMVFDNTTSSTTRGTIVNSNGVVTDNSFSLTIEKSAPDHKQVAQITVNQNTYNGGGEVGEIITMALDQAPDNFLLCDGSEVLKADHPDLYAVIVDTWGAASDPAYFVLPDLMGRFLRGHSLDASLDPDGPRAIGSYQADEFESHNHTTPYGGGGLNAGNQHHVATSQVGGTVTSMGLAGGAETRPVNAAVGYFIRATNSGFKDINYYGAELVVNGDFSNGLSGWSVYTGTGSDSVAVNAQDQAVLTLANSLSLFQTYTNLVVGKKYVVKYDYISGTTTGTRIYDSSNNLASGDNSTGQVQGATGSDSRNLVFTATDTSMTVRIFPASAGTIVIDNISVREINQIQKAGYKSDDKEVYRVAFDPNDFANGDVIVAPSSEGSSELVTNGDFDTGDLTGWTAQGGSTPSVINGELNNDEATQDRVDQLIVVEPNTEYKVSYKVISAGNNQVVIATGPDGTGTLIKNVNSLPAGDQSFTFNSGANTSLYIYLGYTAASGGTAIFDNISVKQIKPVSDIVNCGGDVRNTDTQKYPFPYFGGSDIISPILDTTGSIILRRFVFNAIAGGKAWIEFTYED